MPIHLSNFIAKNDVRSWMNRTFNIDGLVGACNGHSLIVDTTSRCHHQDLPKFENLINPRNKGKLQSQIQSILNEPEKFKWISRPELPKDGWRDCHECDSQGNEPALGGTCKECEGHGALSFGNEHNDYSVSCKSCDGEGREIVGTQPCSRCNGGKKHLLFTPVEKPGLGNDVWALSASVLQTLLTLENCQLAWVEEWENFALRCDGGVGVIMPMRI
jgi:hypothetical protein